MASTRGLVIKGLPYSLQINSDTGNAKLVTKNNASSDASPTTVLLFHILYELKELNKRLR